MWAKFSRWVTRWEVWSVPSVCSQWNADQGVLRSVKCRSGCFVLRSVKCRSGSFKVSSNWRKVKGHWKQKYESECCNSCCLCMQLSPDLQDLCKGLQILPTAAFQIISVALEFGSEAQRCAVLHWSSAGSGSLTPRVGQQWTRRPTANGSGSQQLTEDLAWEQLTIRPSTRSGNETWFQAAAWRMWNDCWL